MITQSARDICNSGVFTTILSLTTFVILFMAYGQVLSTVWSIIDHFVRGNKIQNSMVVPEKMLGVYYLGFLLLCTVLREIKEWNIFYAIPVYIGLVSLIWSVYEAWGKKDGKTA